MRYLLDTNVVIDILRDNKDVTRHYQIETLKRNRIVICPIVYYEVVRGFKIGGATKKFELFLQLYKNWSMLTFNEEVAKKLSIFTSKLTSKLLKTTTFTLRQFQLSTVARSSRRTPNISGASKV